MKSVYSRVLPITLSLFSTGLFSACLLAQAIPVSLEKSDRGWRLQRDGQPYYINGAGGTGSLELLSINGGNSGRTWGVDDVDESMKRLDEAHRHGISIAFGIWIEHERHGFDYDDAQALEEQIELTLSHVRRFKDHPAILVWGIGNEMEGDGRNPVIWKHIEQIAALVKKEDPHHPVMTVIAEIGGTKVPSIHQLCPSIDIIGINSYGGTESLPDRYRQAGGVKPYIVTEFGPNGPWEVGINSIGAVDEPTSTQKADQYRRSYTALQNDTQLCLGSYAFLWGHKQEATATWFGLFLKDGRKTESVDTLNKLWGGKTPENRCPAIEKLTIAGKTEVRPDSSLFVKLTAADPDGDPVHVDWVVMAEADKMATGGDFQKTPSSYPELIQESNIHGLTLRTPQTPGIYRVYAYVGDGRDGAAVSNVSFRVSMEQEDGPVGAKTTLPYVVYDEPGTTSGYAPSGWMGNTGSITMDEKCTDNPREGEHCLKFGYTAGGNWGGVVWQNPPNDWGDQAGGFNLDGAKRLTFWARGEDGGEKIKFGFGLLGRDKTHWDTGKKESDEITLTTEWKQYTIDLKDLNLKRIKTGFYWTLAGQGKPLTFYLDRIAFEEAEKSGADK